MLRARSLLFNAAFYVVTAIFLVIGSPLLLGPRKWATAAHRIHSKTVLWLMRIIAGTRLEQRGRQNYPGRNVLVAAKHQSAWDTIALIPLLSDPALVMKSELLRIPLYGWFCKKFGMIPIERQKGPSALRNMLKAAKDRVADHREVLIFPEGTRRPVGAPPDYKSGIVPVYEALGLPVLPVALNSGLFWPRKSFLRYPGTIIVEYLPPIPPGLPREEFRRRLETEIELATVRLVAEARAANRALPAAVEQPG